jgi:hypothetical protein
MHEQARRPNAVKLIREVDLVEGQEQRLLAVFTEHVAESLDGAYRVVGRTLYSALLEQPVVRSPNRFDEVVRLYPQFSPQRMDGWGHPSRPIFGR